MKIFGIGLSKTGTTSLANALTILGYKVKDCLGVTSYAKGDLSSIDMHIFSTYDAFTDTPIPSFYRELDAQFPNSKFILTVRDMDGWKASCKKQFNQRHAATQSTAHKQLFIDLYGTDVFDPDMFQEGYEKYTNDVIDYFKDRPNDLLIMNIAKGDGWEILCPFLNKPIPDTPFPKANVTQVSWLNPVDVATSIRQESARLRKLYFMDLPESGNGSNNINRNTAPTFPDIGTFNVLRWLRRKRIHRARQNTLALIKKYLRNLNPTIPIVVEDDSSIPYRERRQWNHFWLIGIENATTAIPMHSEKFAPTIYVALVQDRKPFLGVLYFPANDFTYCAAKNKGAYKILRNGPPQEIALNLPTNSAVPVISITSATGNFATAIYHSLILGSYSEQRFTDTKEWQTAAANMILKATGYHIVDIQSGRELEYNKENWSNNSIYIAKSTDNTSLS